MHELRSDSPRARAKPLAAVSLLALGACASPPAVVLDVTSAKEELAARAEERRALEALDALPLGPTALALPPREACALPEQRGYWLVRAIAHSPAARAALGEWKAMRGEAKSAGAPGPLGLQVTDHEFGGDDELVEAVFMFDVLGHLGIGPSGAARARAVAEEALALGSLERAIFDACLRVERARVRCAAARARDAALEELAAEADADLARIEILAANGRIGASEASSARAAAAAVARGRAMLEEALAGAVAELSLAAGVLPDDPALGAVGAAALDDAVRAIEAIESPSNRSSELEAHPRLRERRLRFALAEAELRAVAKDAWPSIGFGPHFARDDDLRIGGMLQLGLPFPSSWRGRLEAAVARRDAAVDAYEDELLELETREREASTRLAVVRARAEGPTRDVIRAAGDGWRSARAVFRVGRGEVMQWVNGLAWQRESSTLAIDEVEALALAALDLVEARGPLAGAFSAEVQP